MQHSQHFVSSLHRA